MTWTDAGRKKAAAERRGKPLPKAVRDKISKALRGKKHPHKGHPQSAATRAKISKALKLKVRSNISSKVSLSLGGRQKHVRRVNFGLSKSRRYQIHVRRHGTTNLDVLQLHIGKTGKTNTTILQIKERRFIHGKPKLSNRGVIHNRVYRRRRSKRSRVAKRVRR